MTVGTTTITKELRTAQTERILKKSLPPILLFYMMYPDSAKWRCNDAITSQFMLLSELCFRYQLWFGYSFAVHFASVGSPFVENQDRDTPPRTNEPKPPRSRL